MRAQEIPPVGLQEARLSDFQVSKVTFDTLPGAGRRRDQRPAKAASATAYGSSTIFGTLAALTWGLLVVFAAFK